MQRFREVLKIKCVPVPNEDVTIQMNNGLPDFAAFGPLFEWWINNALQNRVSNVIHSNPSISLPLYKFDNDRSWLTCAVNVVEGVLQYKAKVEAGHLKYCDEEWPLCMHQYHCFLSNCRIPGTPFDRLLYRRGNERLTRPISHICVVYRDNFYRLNIEPEKEYGKYSRPAFIYHQLEHIVANADKLLKDGKFGYGMLTALTRDDWARCHKHLARGVVNSKNFDNIERSLFLLCLDEYANIDQPAVENNDESHNLIQSHPSDRMIAANLLHGQPTDGFKLLSVSENNSSNRWFDKSLQFIVSRDGCLGVNFEPTATDAQAILAVLEQVVDQIDRGSDRSLTLNRLPVYARPTLMKWQTTEESRRGIRKANDVLGKLAESFQVHCATFTGFGFKAIRDLGHDEDSFIQMSLQLAYARLHPEQSPPSTHETGSLRRFHLGRTDTIRPCSLESVELCRIMTSGDDKTATHSDRVKALKAALDQHKAQTQDVLAGQAFDRHLFGLKWLAERNLSDVKSPYSIPSFFTDPTFEEATSSYKLSTNRIESPVDANINIGPMHADGYSVCYNIQSNKILLFAASFKTSQPRTWPDRLIIELGRALQDLYSLSQSSA